ncbi:MAG: GNAT family N-acetyltransferase [Parvularculaceae bacterium]|nr:GNAT family N-acetyltransferase [Parvularculaceae bacterium]
MNRRIDVTITYLEQRTRPTFPAPPRPPGKTAMLRADPCPVHFYRYLYAIVGEPWKWVSRKRLKDADLARILADPAVSVYVLYVGGAPAGFAEIEQHADKTADIKFFGLVPEQIGRGLGRYFLANILDVVWAAAPSRVALETCTLDHPAALPLYQKMGFSAYDQKRGVVEVTDEEAVKAGAAR